MQRGHGVQVFSSLTVATQVDREVKKLHDMLIVNAHCQWGHFYAVGGGTLERAARIDGGDRYDSNALEAFR